jgi:hypothetical protein
LETPVARFDGRILTVALYALLLGCGREPRQPGPAAVPAPAAQPQAAPPDADAPTPKADPNKKSTQDSTDVDAYPWQSGPIAAL